MRSNSSNHNCTEASLGIRQSPLGLRLTLPTFGPSGKQERLNCCEKKRRTNTFSHVLIVVLEYDLSAFLSAPKALQAR